MIDVSRHPGIHFLLWRLGIAAAQTQTTAAERQCLQSHAAGRRRLAEIGVWHGVNTRRLKAAMAHDGMLFAIDPFPASRFGFSWEQRIAFGEVGRELNGHVQFLQMTSAEAAERFPSICSDPLDFVFVDGDHSYEGLATDWTLWTPLIAGGGVIALHDSQSFAGRNIDNAGSVQFTRERVLADPRFRVLNRVDSLTVLQRKQTES